jgi:hypothetical protein
MLPYSDILGMMGFDWDMVALGFDSDGFVSDDDRHFVESSFLFCIF